MIPNISEVRAARLLSLYEAAEREILRKLAKRFAGVPDAARLPAWIARKQAEVLKAVQEITAVLAELEAASREMRTAMLEAAYQMGAENFNDELSRQGADGLFSSLDINLAPEGAQALAPLMDEIDGRFSELHRRILRESEDEYQKIIADVLPNAALGVDSVREATRAALNAFANKGIAGFTDRAGRFWGMAEYAEMAVRTGLKLAHIAGFTQNALAKGYDLVIISDHADTCPICSKWERKVLSLTGMQADDPECDGWLADAQRDGLFHPNCQHDMAVYVPGQTDRRAGHDISAEGRRKDEQGYNNRQKQRYYERMVRRWKRRQAAALTPEDEREARGHVAQWQKKLRTLTTEAHLRRKYEREGGRVTLSDEAKRLKPLQIGENGGIIKNSRNLAWLKSGYELAVGKGDLSALTGFAHYVKVAKEVEKTLVGITTADGVEIKEYTTHFLDRIIGSYVQNREPVAIDDILSSLTEPRQIVKRSEIERSYIHRENVCKTSVNPAHGRLVQTSPKQKGK